MARTAAGDQHTALPAYPSMRAAAEMVGVSPSSLQRRSDIETIPCGREHRLDPRTVLRLTLHYGNRSVMEAANDLVAHSLEHAPSHVEAIEQIVDSFMQERHEERRAAGEIESLTIEQVLDELVPYIRGEDRADVEIALRRAAVGDRQL